LRTLELGDGRNDVLVPVEDEQEVGVVDLQAGRSFDRLERERRAAVLRVARVVEVDLVPPLRDVLEVRVWLGDRAIDGRLVVGVEAEGLGETAVLGRMDTPVGHPRDEVVLYRQRAVLAREGRRRLAGPGKAD